MFKDVFPPTNITTMSDTRIVPRLSLSVSMTGPVELTFDIWELVIDILSDGIDSESDLPSLGLRNLALTCKAMVPLCRRHLFSTLNLSVAGSNKNLLHDLIGRFHELVSNPAIIRWVRHLTHTIYFPDDVRLHQILEVLCSSTSLRVINLDGRSKDWNTLTRPFQILLTRLIHLPTITKVEMSSMKNVPSSILVGCSSITHISLTDITFERGLRFTQTSLNYSDVDIVDHPITSPPRPIYFALSNSSYDIVRLLAQPSGPTRHEKIIDFSGLREAVFQNVSSAGDMKFLQQALEISRALQSLEITADTPLLWTGLGASMSAWNVGTLRKLILGPRVISRDKDPLLDLVSELTLIAGINVIEEVSLEVFFENETEYRADTDNWSAFDALLTRHRSFPMLTVVAVDIVWMKHSALSDEEIATRITKNNFPQLLESKVPEFRFCVDVFDVNNSLYW